MAAQRIQEHLLPRSAPKLPGLDIAGFLHPAEFAAGDHFDYLSMQGGALGTVIGDVSGHGFDSALLMASTHAYLRSLVEMYDDTSEILRHANAFLAKEIELGRFVTLLFGRLDPVSRAFEYANAGHPTGYVLDRKGEVKAYLSSTAMPLGLMSSTEFPAVTIPTLEPGDILLLLTDGVLEAESPDGEEFGVERTFEVVRSVREKSADDIVSALRNAICDFSQRKTFADDATAIVVKIDNLPTSLSS